MAKKKSKKKIAKKKAAKKVSRKPSKLTTCYYCLQEYSESRGHDCVPLTERDLLATLDEDFREAFLTLRSRAEEFGEQKIYNNARAIMFSRRVCYMFVRLKKTYLELCFFLPREEKDLSIHSVKPVTKTKFVHTFKLIHSDQIEEPLTDWLREAYAASV
jgi:hypothetical protein